MDPTKKSNIKTDTRESENPLFTQHPNENQATIPNAQMTYFMPSDIPWEEQTSQSRRKIIRLEDDLYVALIQWDAGFKRQDVDRHGGEETVYVLDGTFSDGGPACGPGSIIRGDAGSSHQPWTDDGVTFFVTRTLTPGEREKFEVPPGSWKRP